MRIEPLISFCTVVEKGSFQEAASILFLTQPAVSMNVKQLEKEFGQTLLIRKGKGKIELTPMGEKLYDYSVRLRDQLKELEMLKQESTQQVQFEIIIDCNITAGLYWLTSISNRFQMEFPKARISINHTNLDESVDNLLDEKSDLALLLSPVHHPQLQTTLSWEDELKVIISKNSSQPISYLSANDLIEQPFILPSKGLPTRVIIDKLFNDHLGTKAKCVFEIGNPEALKRSVRTLDKLGIILASSLDETDRNSLSFVSSEINMHCKHVLLQKKKRFHSKTFHEFVSYIMEKTPIQFV
ncbi:LysR family transcriptional regulator [Bacillus sp. Marseille-P3661]|uniref:LysR family transcriptional regulator n=1 Tax=Bacillus sp. Marseille-P3661 TaxID=1936234 RepID=UPI000C85EF59|nr:LysR family transcriptional regulator [Bacillus sp. Marseille-P3661]